MKIRCITQFDITATGVRSTLNKNRIPFRDAAGHVINDEASWHRSRNQQRNWETLTQIISLRTSPLEITGPDLINESSPKSWQFDFEIERPDSIALGEDPLGALRIDCQDVPMLTGLDETPGQQAVLVLDRNIRFLVLSH